MGGFLLGWILVWLTEWGMTFEVVGFNAMGIPILEVYVFLAWGIVIIVGKGIERWQKKQRDFQLTWRWDVLIVISLYLFAALIWRETTAPYNWFVTQPYPPNYQPYPSSDALRYDTTGQSILIGEGLKTENSHRTLRPLYTGIIGILHALSGPDYEPVVNLQPFIMAIFPIFLYFIGRQMHSRMAGLFLAMLIIFREQTAIELSGRITTSHAKLLMADLPTAVALAGFILLVIMWLKAEHPNWKMALFSGGALGASMLIRPESLLMAGVVGIVALFTWRKQMATWLIQFLIFGFGILLITAPWMYRNWQRYDIVFFDAPNGRLEAVIERALAVPPTLPTEHPIQVTTVPAPQAKETILPEPTLQAPPKPDSSLDKAVNIISDQPQAVSISIINHYLNSEIQSILALPTAFRLPDNLINLIYHRDIDRFYQSCCQAIGYYDRMPFWQSWGSLPPSATLLLLGNLFLISTGIGLAYVRLKWVGIFPLLAHTAFLAGLAIFRTSGGRFIIPVNWIMVIYFALGVVAVTLWAGKLLDWLITQPGWNVEIPSGEKLLENRHPKSWVGVFAPILGLLMFGFSLPILESAFPVRYPPGSQESMLAGVMQSVTQEDLLGIEKWLQTEGIVVRTGRALYPRYLEAGTGESDKEPTVMKRSYDRLTFALIGPYSLRVHLPISHAPYFQNGSDVLVIGCIYNDDMREVIDAEVVAQVDIDGKVTEMLWRSASPPAKCLP
jgi:hypothetical protein